jgi:cysteinyl-tRNA synthetase
MAGMIRALEANGHTYSTDGSIYFKISTFPEYGRLARLDHSGIKSGARVDSDKYEKEDARDFVLWKAAKPDEPSWEPGLPKGRPGWHIECSAMAAELLDPLPIDIHGGGVDLIFPHHENEIAQAEGATKQTFSRFWVHVEHLFVENEKMSKSVGNVYTVPDVVAKGYRPSALRYLLLSSHYRKQLNFTWTGIEQAEEALRRIVDFLAKLDDMTHATGAGDVRNAALDEAVGRARDAFRDALASDLNTAAGLAAVFDLVREGNSAIAARKMSAADARVVRDAIEDLDRVLGVIALRRAEDATPDVPVNEIEQLIDERKAAKQRREFARADDIRKSLADRGILLEDTPAGTRWKKK